MWLDEDTGNHAEEGQVGDSVGGNTADQMLKSSI